ncbi:MAG: hypothetical protein JWL83_3765, partial [Actinomycetia bacterium]|nr:hypothetical protein [Actinomycetes bacterium]
MQGVIDVGPVPSVTIEPSPFEADAVLLDNGDMGPGWTARSYSVIVRVLGGLLLGGWLFGVTLLALSSKDGRGIATAAGVAAVGVWLAFGASAGRKDVRVVLWALGAAVLSLWVDVIASPFVHFSDKAGVTAALLAAALGVWGSFQAPLWVRDRAVHAFSVGYVALLVVPWPPLTWEKVVAASSVTALVAMVSYARQVLPLRIVVEVQKFVAAVAWVVTGLGIFVMLLGLFVLPLALSATIMARRSERTLAASTGGR